MRVLLSEDDIQQEVLQLAQTISSDYRDKPLTIVGILQDSIVLMADLMRRLEIPAQMRVIQPYLGHVGPDKPGLLCISDITQAAVDGRHVLLIEDVFDTGRTLAQAISQFDDCNPLSVRSAVLLRKETGKEVVIEPDYVLFEIPDELVVGYGLDYHGSYRHLPHIALLETEDILADQAVLVR